MKSNNTNLSKGLILIALILIMGSMDTFAQKRVLLEQHTGAWCGWCTDGTVIMNNLIEQYPDRVIGVKWHNGDAMAIPEQAQCAQSFLIKGYPGGTVDRKPYNGDVGLGRGLWAGAVTQSMNSENVVDVSVNYNYDPSTRKITATVTGKALKAQSRQLALNLYIVEDYCSGTGNQWDQRNYLSGNASFVGHPYYSQPDPIKGYQHMKTLRKVLGGVYGSTKNVTPTLTAGQEFSETFSVNMESAWNADNVYVIGVVQAFVVSGTSLIDGSIVNVVEAGKKEALKTTVNVLDAHKMTAPGETSKRKFKLKNPQNFQITVNLASSGTPNGWEVSYPGSVNIVANGEVEVEATITAPTGTPSFAEFKFTATPKKFAEYTAVSANGSFTALTDNTKFIYYTGTNSNTNAFTSAMSGLPYNKDFAFVPFGLDYIEAYKPLYFDVVFISNNLGGQVGLFGGGSAASTATFNAVQQAINAGKRVVINSDYDLSIALGTNGTQAARNFYSFLGVEGGEYVLRRQYSNGQWGTQLFNFPVKGVHNDVISHGMSFTGNQYNATTNPYFTYLTDVLKIKEGSGGVPFLIMDDNESRIGGIRFEKGQSKYIYMSVGFEALLPADRANLIDKIMLWLKTETVADGPKISVDNKTVAFGSVDTDKYKEMDVKLTNSGDAELKITAIANQDLKEVFSIIGGAELKSIAAGEDAYLKIRFEPKSGGQFIADVVITTNAVNEGSTVLKLSGSGNTAGNVAYGSTPNGVLTMSMTPNPVVENSQFNYTVSGDASRNVKIYVMDVSGKVVSELVNSSLSAGTYNLSFSNTNYVSGTYFIMADVDGSQAQIPVVIVK